MSILDEIEADAKAEAEKKDLSQAVKLATHMIALDGEIDRVEAKLKELKKARDDVAQNKLPDILAEIGVKEFKLADGRSVTIKEDLKISVPKSRKKDICQWLRDNNRDGLISNTVTIEIDKGKDNSAAAIMDTAAELGLTAVREEDVNSGSLKKVLKEELVKNPSLDLGFFGAFSLREAKVEQ